MNILYKLQLFSSHALGVMMFCWFGGKVPCYKGDCRTAPATPGLLKIPLQYSVIILAAEFAVEGFTF